MLADFINKVKQVSSNPLIQAIKSGARSLQEAGVLGIGLPQYPMVDKALNPGSTFVEPYLKEKGINPALAFGVGLGVDVLAPGPGEVKSGTKVAKRTAQEIGQRLSKPLPKEVESPVIREARKYKSAEEFVKSEFKVKDGSQNLTTPNSKLRLYRGEQSNASLNFDRTPTHNVDSSAKGVYFTPNKVTASKYSDTGNLLSKDTLKEFYKLGDDVGSFAEDVYKNGRANANWKGIPRNSRLDEIGNDIADIVARIDGAKDPVRLTDQDIWFGNTATLPEYILSRAKKIGIDPKPIKATNEYFFDGRIKNVKDISGVEGAKKEGYDAVRFYSKENGEEIFVINQNAIKTKSQLTKLWEEANKGVKDKKISFSRDTRTMLNRNRATAKKQLAQDESRKRFLEGLGIDWRKEIKK